MDYSQYGWMVFFVYIFVYIVIKILNFYDIGNDVYGVYLVFLIFILLSMMVLPHSYSIMDD